MAGSSFGRGQGGGTGFIIQHLQRCGENSRSDYLLAHLTSALSDSGAVGVGEAVPLIAEDRLDPVVAREDTRQRRVSKERRFKELREMDILGPGRDAQEQEEYQV